MHRRMWLRCTQFSRLEPSGLPHLPHALAPQLARAAQWFHAASDTTRLAILEFLSQRDRSPSELHEILAVPRSRISFHLKVLAESGLIRVRRDGRWRLYGLCGETLTHMTAVIRTVQPGAHVGTCVLTCCRGP